MTTLFFVFYPDTNGENLKAGLAKYCVIPGRWMGKKLEVKKFNLLNHEVDFITPK